MQENQKIEKVIIIGSGPAGYTAALYTSRAQLDPLMLTGFMAGGLPGGQLMTTTEVENYPGFVEGISGPELMEIMKKQAMRFGLRSEAVDVERVDFSKRPFALYSQDNVFYAESVILATGASARYLGLQSEKRLMNRGVSACATCDGALPMFRQQHLIVVGGGDTAMEEALFLSRFAKKVSVIHRRSSFRASKVMLERAQAHEKIEFLVPYEIDSIVGENAVTGVVLRHSETSEKKEIEARGVFMAIGHTPNTAIFQKEIELDDAGYILTHGKSSYTNIPGIFACGDAQDHTYRQAITAAGSGCTAAIDTERWLAAQ